MSDLNAFIDLSPDQFSLFMRAVVNNQCRFITRNNDNISRCPSKRWWKAFLNGCTKRFKLPHKKPARSALARAERGLRQYVRTIYTLFQEIGLEGVYRFFETEVNYLKAQGKDVLNPEIAENLREDIRDYEKMTSVKHYTYNSACDYKYGFEKKVSDDRAVYRYVLSNYDKQMHELFMTGQEVLFSDIS